MTNSLRLNRPRQSVGSPEFSTSCRAACSSSASGCRQSVHSQALRICCSMSKGDSASRRMREMFCHPHDEGVVHQGQRLQRCRRYRAAGRGCGRIGTIKGVQDRTATSSRRKTIYRTSVQFGVFGINRFVVGCAVVVRHAHVVKPWPTRLGIELSGD